MKKIINLAAKSLQSCPTLCNPRDGSPPGSPVPGILQARTLEWVAISFSSAWKWKVKVKSLSRVRLLAILWTVAFQAPPSMGFSRQEYWSGLPLPSPYQPRQHVKKQRHYFAKKGLSSQSYGFSSSHAWMWELDHKESWVPKNWCFLTTVLEKTLEGPLDCKESQPVHHKGNQSWIFIGRTDADAETPALWPPDAKNWLRGKDPDAGKDWGQEETGTTEDEMVGCHHQLDGHEFEETPEVGDGQGSPACCSPWGHRVGHDWATELNWTGLRFMPPQVQLRSEAVSASTHPFHYPLLCTISTWNLWAQTPPPTFHVSLWRLAVVLKQAGAFISIRTGHPSTRTITAEISWKVTKFHSHPENCAKLWEKMVEPQVDSSWNCSNSK